jgi:hypothetical protein
MDKKNAERGISNKKQEAKNKEQGISKSPFEVG